MRFPHASANVGGSFAKALQPLGVVRSDEASNGGSDVQSIVSRGAATVDLDQSLLGYFDIHHTPEDTFDQIDPAQLRQAVAAWATMLSIVPEPNGDQSPDMNMNALFRSCSAGEVGYLKAITRK
jgi:hypothetical protein